MGLRPRVKLRFVKKKKKLKRSKTSVTKFRSYSGPVGQLWTQMDPLAGLGFLTRGVRNSVIAAHCYKHHQTHDPTSSALGRIEFILRL